jgi:L-threonylcarbamoyladenylate synthase
MASFRWMSRMTRVIDYSDPGDHRMVVQAALDALREPQLVGLPSECGYLLATSSTNAAGAQQLLKIAKSIGGQALLCLSHPDQLPDFVEPLSSQALRLARRGWPGPIILEFVQSGWSGPPLDAAVVKYFGEGISRFVCSGHPLFAGLGRVQREPLLVVEAPAPTGKTWAQADGLELAHAWGDQIGLIVNAGFVSCPQGPTAVQFTADGNWSIARPGVYSPERIARLMAKSILFVCTGNTCRSPMAEGLFRSLLSDRLKCREDELPSRGFQVGSAGVAALPGAPASPNTLEVLDQAGIDLTGHASQPVTEQLVAWADLVLTMTSRHLSAVVGAFPDSSSKVQLLCPEGDVADPFGGDLRDYQECGEQIRLCLEYWLDQVMSDD